MKVAPHQLWKNYWDSLPTVWEGVAILVGFAILVWLSLRLKTWFRDGAADDESPVNLMSEMRELHRQGDLTDDEFRLIKTRLAGAAAGAMLGQGASSRRPLPKQPAASAAPIASPSTESRQGRSETPDTDGHGPNIPSTQTSEAQDAPGSHHP